MCIDDDTETNQGDFCGDIERICGYSSDDEYKCIRITHFVVSEKYPFLFDLHVSVKNDGVISFYEKYGFVTKKKELRYYSDLGIGMYIGEGLNAHLMALDKRV